MIHDLIIVGAGVAGWTAARRAQQLGLDPVLLEKHTAAPGWGNGRLSGGWFHAAFLNPATRTPDELYAEIRRTAGEFTRAELARAWADNAARALDFLRGEGGVFAPVGEAEEAQNVAQPPRPAGLGQDWNNKGPDRLLKSMAARYLARGGAFKGGRRGVELVVEDGRVIGVIADTGGYRERYVGRAVLLCDGGFQANPGLVERYITREYKLRGSVSDTGDALQMGLAVGAKVVNMEFFYGHCLTRDSLRNDALWPGFVTWPLIDAGMLVDGFGKRFCDEGARDEVVAWHIARSRTPGGCWAIFDDEAWETVGRSGPYPLNPYLPENGGTVHAADSVEELADLAGLPAEPLAASLQAHRSHLACRTPLVPARSGTVRPIAKRPYRAMPVIAGITFTMGGLLVNANGQVLDERERPIPNLYAAGGTMGGLQGGPGFGYTGGWSEATVFGLLVAEHVARTIGARRRGQ